MATAQSCSCRSGITIRPSTDLDEVIRVAPNSARALRERAWILATCPDAKLRKPDVARASATPAHATELTDWSEPQTLMTLAAACSETGDFTTAVKWQQKAVDLLAAKSPERHEYRRLLDRYKASKPYHRLSILEESGIQIPGACGQEERDDRALKKPARKSFVFLDDVLDRRQAGSATASGSGSLIIGALSGFTRLPMPRPAMISAEMITEKLRKNSPSR